MYNPENMTYDTSVRISNERYVELVRKEAQFEFIKKMLETKNDYTDITDVKILLDIKKEESENE